MDSLFLFRNIKLKEKLPRALTFIKYGYSLVLILAVFIRCESVSGLIVQLPELITIVLAFEFFVRKKRKLANVLNAIVVLLFNAQLAIMFFGTSYLSMIMVTNLTLLGDLSGKAAVFIPNLIVLLICSCLPICPVFNLDRFEIPKRVFYVMPAVIWLGIAIIAGIDNSPYLSYGLLARDGYKTWSIHKTIEASHKEYNDSIKEQEEEEEEPEAGYEFWEDDSEFYKPGVVSGWEEKRLSEKPNVIFIMSEGLSQSIVDDSREIMPRLREYEGKSLFFTNYYDHSIATYRGIIGQLYSGHQFIDVDDNKLVGIQDIFEDEGYKSVYINTEPHMEEFVKYVNGLNFDEVISEPGEYEGQANALSDKEAFERLKSKMAEEAKNDKPYFITMYTFGTHATLGSPHEKFGDGNNEELNKFYNLDHWFGEFMDWFNSAGELTDDTLIVYSSDHATYIDSDWPTAFPDNPRKNLWIDTVPCLFYHKGITPEVIDVNGKNTINIAPTIIDYVNVGEEHPNYFLGSSLFTEDENYFSTLFYSKDFPGVVDTKGGELRAVSAEEQSEFEQIVTDYFVKKRIGIVKKTEEITEEPEQSEEDELNEPDN